MKTVQASQGNVTSDLSDGTEHASSNQVKRHPEDNIEAAAQPKSTSSNDTTGTELGANNRLPGDSLRSARIANTVASLQEQPQDNQPTDSKKNRNNTSVLSQEKSEANESVSLPYEVPKTQFTQPVSGTTTTSEPATPSDAFPLPLPQREPAESNGVSKPSIPHDARKESIDAEKRTDSFSNNEKSDQKQSKRKSGRSAIPSWDEILFGE